MNLVKSACIAAAFTLSAQVAAVPVTITFDDLVAEPYGTEVANGYAGLDWNNFFVLSGTGAYLGSSYDHAVVSPANTIYNGGNLPASFSSSSATFSLISLYVTKAWNEGVTHFAGYAGDTLLYALDVNSSTAGPTLVSFSQWDKLTRVVVSDGDGSAQSALDNITIDAVPEPATYAMLLGGLAVLAAAARRQRRR
jgi:hypothetical protein